MRHRFLAPLLGVTGGGGFFAWIAGWQLISPVSVEWAMKFDWRIHFLGWHLFRHEPWSIPPGRLVSYYHAPHGTAIGYTDSIPLLALPLKLVSAWLPVPMQYLGIWMLACFALQGLFGVLIARLWTRSLVSQVSAGLLFVIVPTLLNRAQHPALCAHWVLLWAIWLYFRWRPGDAVPLRQMVTLALVVSLIHPYLAAMTTALLCALAVRCVTTAPRADRPSAAWRSAAALALVIVVLLAGWWMSGLFLVTGASMARPGLTLFSMNLLGPVTPQGWSRFIPEIPIAAGGQLFEGFHYLGAGILALIVAALVVLVVGRRPSVRLGGVAPLLIVASILAVYALSPRISLGGLVLLDASSPWLERLAVFGVTGRFFWPFSYVILSLAIAVTLTCWSASRALVLLLLAVVLQVVDLQPAFSERRTLVRTPAFHEWPERPSSPAWAAALPNYRHLVLYNPLQCGPAPVLFEPPAYLAGLYGLTVNVGEVARSSESEREAYCAALDRSLAAGLVSDDTLYLVHPANEARLRSNAPQLVCGAIDGLRVCATTTSYALWSTDAELR